MRIAFVSTILGYPWGGADALWTPAAEAAAARGDELLVSVSSVVASDPRIAALAARGAKLHLRTPPTPPVSIGARVSRRLKRLVSSADPVAEALNSFQPGLVVISLGAAYDLTEHPEWIRWLSDSRTPYRLIVNFQLDVPELSSGGLPAMRDCFSRADRIFFVSSRNRAVTQGHLGIALENATVVQYPMRWTPADTTAWPSEQPWSLAAVARLEPVKGLDLLLPALAEALPRSEEDWRFEIYGRGPGDAELRALAEKVGLKSRVHFRGYVADLRSIWSENHILLSPARDEGVPITLPEALLSGRPALATAVGGAADWIVPGVTGFICPKASIPDLVTTLKQAWEHRHAWRTMGERAAVAAAAFYRAQDHLQVIARLDSKPGIKPTAHPQ